MPLSQIKSINIANFSKLSLRRKIGYFGILIGLIGMWVCLRNMPDTDSAIRKVAIWAAADMAFTVIAISSTVAAMANISSLFLKILDLIWVSATAIGVTFAVIQAYSNAADDSRHVYERNLVETREKAIGQLSQAYAIECNSLPTSRLKCNSLAQLKTALSTHGIIGDQLVNAACPSFPINPSLPFPTGYSSQRIEGCISSKYISYVLQLPIILDKPNAIAWAQRTRLWPLLLIFFVALRLSKGISEVFWK